MRSIKLMKKLSEKINARRMGGLMKIRFLALVIGTIAIMTSGVVLAQTTTTGTTTGTTTTNTTAANNNLAGTGSMSLNIPISVKGFDLDFGKLFGTGANNNATNQTMGMWKCVVEPETNWDRANDSLAIIGKGILGFKALMNQANRDDKGFKYLTDVNAADTAWKTTNSTLFYSAQTMMYHDFVTHPSIYGAGGSGSASPAVMDVASQTFQSYWGNWLGGGNG